MIEIGDIGFNVGSVGVIIIRHEPSIPTLSGGETEMKF